MANALGDKVIREGVVVTLGHNMFSLPKLQWFSLRASGLFYAARARKSNLNETCPESMIEFETMFVRVEKIEEMDSKFSFGDDKAVAVYCLRVGDKRNCRTLCFVSWEERDFWVISILHAIAQFKISNQVSRQERLCAGGKIRCNSAASLRSRPKAKKHSSLSLRQTRSSECDRESRKSGIRRRFSSLRLRKSLRDSRDGDFNDILRKTASLRSSGVFGEADERFYQTVSRHSLSSQAELETESTVFCEVDGETACADTPPSPRYKPWLDFGMKRHFSSFITKFT